MAVLGSAAAVLWAGVRFALATGAHPRADGSLALARSGQRLAISATSNSLSANPTAVGTGGTVTASWTTVNPTSTDWIGVYATGAANTAYQNWLYDDSCLQTSNGSASSGGGCPIQLPSTPGTYELRLLADNGYTLLATSQTITVNAAALTANPTAVSTGGSVTASWSNVGTPSSTDWIGVYATGAANTAYQGWLYDDSCNQTGNGTTTGGGSCPIRLPTTPGTYELRLFSNNGYTLLATSQTITVNAPTLTASATAVGTGGSVTASWSNVGTPTNTDWIGVYATGAANTAYQGWLYDDSCNQTSNGTTTGGGSCPIRLPTTPGTYELRLFANNGYTLLATSQTITVNAPTPGYQNPVYASAAFPDPFVLDNGDTHSDYWAFATGSLFPVLHSGDLVHWTSEGTAMTVKPDWVVSTGDWHPWAPSVIQTTSPCPGANAHGCDVMYYVGLSATFNRNCIGVATSPTPAGPYTDRGPLALSGQPSRGSSMPIGCGDAAGVGNIDPSPFVDPSGQAYLYLSTSNVCTSGSCTLKPTISVIPLTSTLLQAARPRVPLFSGDAGTWEAAGAPAPTVEGPSMELHNGTYYLFYSGGSYTHGYGMGYATSSGPTVPFTKAASNPILASTTSALSVGGGDRLVTGPHGGLWMVYAARLDSYSNPRTLWLDPFSWQPANTPGAPDVPVIAGPTTTPQTTQP